MAAAQPRLSPITGQAFVAAQFSISATPSPHRLFSRSGKSGFSFWGGPIKGKQFLSDAVQMGLHTRPLAHAASSETEMPRIRHRAFRDATRGCAVASHGGDVFRHLSAGRGVSALVRPIDSLPSFLRRREDRIVCREQARLSQSALLVNAILLATSRHLPRLRSSGEISMTLGWQRRRW